MTVKELIDLLASCDPEATVVVEGEDLGHPSYYPPVWLVEVDGQQVVLRA